MQRQLERKVAKLAEGPGEFGDRARTLLAALQADIAAMLRPPTPKRAHKGMKPQVRDGFG